MHRDFNREKQGFCARCFSCVQPCENKLRDDTVKSSAGCYSVDCIKSLNFSGFHFDNPGAKNTCQLVYTPVAQWTEHRSSKPKVRGSNPLGGAIQ